MTEHESAISCRALDVSFGHHRVLRGINLDLSSGRVLGLVGESGSGKSTLAKVLVGAVSVEAGEVRVLGQDVRRMTARRRREFARRVQMIPQDPYSSLDPRQTIGQALAEALDPRRADVRRHRDRIERMLVLLGLDPSAERLHPHQFSGGQRQRIAIARALVVEPQLIIADEITSALDVVVQAEVINTLMRLRDGFGFSMLFVTHNLAVAQDVCDKIAVMHSGEIVEHGSVDDVFTAPAKQYTRDLLNSVPGSAGFILDPAEKDE